MESEAARGDVLTGSGTDVDLEVIRAWWSLRGLPAIRRLTERGFARPHRAARSTC